MANRSTRESEVSLSAFITLLLTHCYSVFAILEKRVYVDDDLRRSYRLEDFLWSGSGDGENETEVPPIEEQIPRQLTTTIIYTTTIFSTSTVVQHKTIIITNSTGINVTSSQCTNDSECKIEPTPTIKLTSTTPLQPSITDYPIDNVLPDSRYWLITVLKMNATAENFIPFEMEQHLAKLYKIAFHRHQEDHLGLNSTWNRSNFRSYSLNRLRIDYRDTSVTVRIHNITINNVLNILYSVKVSGRSVLATTAAQDMNLVSDAEVAAELGYPVLTKAEPYLKFYRLSNQESFFEEKEYLLVLISSICLVVLLILLIILIITFVIKCKKKRKILESEKEENQTFFKKQNDIPESENSVFSNENANIESEDMRRSPSLKEQTHDVTKKSEDFIRNRCYFRFKRKPASTNSFLSMPSVKNFPVSPLPEPLTDLLNKKSPPMSKEENEYARTFTRHSSIDGQDPGVLGPVVWQSHCHQLQNQISGGDDNLSLEDADIDIGEVRKRVNKLLDDALSLYGSHHTLGDNKESNLNIFKQNPHRAHSAAPFKDTDNYLISSRTRLRPKTGLNAKPEESTSKNTPQPKDAWGGTSNISSRPQSRPLSAGPFHHHPTVYSEITLTDSRQLSSNDSTVPIINAIRQELDKIPKYKSTTEEYLKQTKKRILRTQKYDV